MSVYSTDSLEDINEISSKKQPVSKRLIKKERENIAEPNKSKSCIGTDKGTRTAGRRNAIIANRRLVDASRRGRPASSRNGKRDVADRLKRNNVEKSKQEEDTSSKKLSGRNSKSLSKTIPTKRNGCSKDNTLSMKPQKKLGNVLPSKIQQARKSRSYLELYRRRFDGPRCNGESPEGSTLSVCGDSEREQVTDDDTHSSTSPRDDRSELSFYRRIIEGSVNPLVRVTRSNETQRPPAFQDTAAVSSCTIGIKRDTSDEKSKILGYRPYTIEEYKTLSIPKLDRSLGPDKIEMQAKREWLMRRRTYGNSVSARNRQRILLRAHRQKAEGNGIGGKCFLPLLKEQSLDAKTQADSISSMISEDPETSRKGSSINSVRYSKRSHNFFKIPSRRRSKKFERTSSFCSTLNLQDVIDEDPYLESLRERHLQEKQMIDRIIKQAVCP